MAGKTEIGLWDDDIERIKRTHGVMEKLLRQMRIQAYICTNCEPPQLGRSNLFGKFPVIEVNGNYWHRKPNEDISEEQLAVLFRHLVSMGELSTN